MEYDPKVDVPFNSRPHLAKDLLGDAFAPKRKKSGAERRLTEVYLFESARAELFR